MENISALENSSAIVNVTLHENQLRKDGSYYGLVSKNKASFNNIISEIAEDNKGIDPHMLQYAAILIQKKILKMLEQGKCVNILDLATMYIGLECNAKNKNEVNSTGNLVVKITPTQLVKNAISSIQIDKIVYHDANPEIDEIIDLSTKKNNSILTKGKPAKIIGKKLKLGGEKYGLYFAKVDNNDFFSKDESTWIKVDDDQIFRNMPKELNFFVPDTLENNTIYKILVKSSYMSKGRSRKEAVFISSENISIAG